MVLAIFRKYICFVVICLACQPLFAETGVTSNSIVLGQSAALSGSAKNLGERMRDGALAYFNYVNAQGGVNGRKIILKTLDDGYDAQRAADNTRQLLEKDEVFALFGYVGTSTSMAALPMVRKARVPFFAPMSGVESLRNPLIREVFNIRAGYDQEVEQIVDHAMALSLKRVAVLYQNDAYGQSGLDSARAALSKRRQQVIGAMSIEKGSLDLSGAASSMLKLKPDAVIIITTYATSASFIQAMRKAVAVPPIFWNVSFVGGQDLVNALGKDARGVMISQVVPLPWANSPAIVTEYKKIYANKPANEIGFVSMEGFIAAKVLVEGLRRAGSNLTRDSLIKALEGMNRYDAGGYEVSFSDRRHNGSSLVDLTAVNKSGQFIH